MSKPRTAVQLQIFQVELIIFLLVDSCLNQGVGVIHCDGAGSYHAYSFEVFGTPDRSKSALSRTVAGIMHQAGGSAKVLTGWPNGQHCRPLGGIAFTSFRLKPVFVPGLASYIIKNDLLTLPGVRPP